MGASNTDLHSGPEPGDGALDQSRDQIAVQSWGDGEHLRIQSRDRDVLRRLGGEVAALAARPIEACKRELWTRHNALESVRPVVLCDPEGGWKEIIPQARIQCQNPLARQWEMQLRKEVFWGAQMGDDYTIDACFDIPHCHAGLDWGLRETRIGGQAGGAYTWESPIKSDADVARLHYPEIKVDDALTQDLLEVADSILGDLLTVRVKTIWWWSLGLTRLLVELRGLQQVMFDVYENPGILHAIMTLLRAGTLAMLDHLEANKLLSLNNDGTYVGSGGLGWTSELPQRDHGGPARCADMWGFCESQETVGVSPDTFAEFVFPYQLPILERFGLNCYGCCEPLDKRWHIVKQIPNLRRVSVSPWADKAKMAEALKGDYIYSLKPSPTDLAMAHFDEDRIRKELREVLAITRGCRLELIMKDNHTLRHEPQRVIRWVQIAREEIDRL
jgi:hypothetical protein